MIETHQFPIDTKHEDIIRGCLALPSEQESLQNSPSTEDLPLLLKGKPLVVLEKLGVNSSHDAMMNKAEILLGNVRKHSVRLRVPKTPPKRLPKRLQTGRACPSHGPFHSPNRAVLIASIDLSDYQHNGSVFPFDSRLF